MTATWKEQGPRPILTNTIKQQAGAIRSVVAHPTNPDIIWVGGVNGGVWKTTNATTDSTWTTSTDALDSLSVTALDLDLADTNYNTLVAGIGRFSSFAGVGGKLIGLAKTTNGGTSWTPIGGTVLSNR